MTAQPPGTQEQAKVYEKVNVSVLLSLKGLQLCISVDPPKMCEEQEL